jgi:hypothetical protein
LAGSLFEPCKRIVVIFLSQFSKKWRNFEAGILRCFTFLDTLKRYGCLNFEHAFKYPAQFLRKFGGELLSF